MGLNFGINHLFATVQPLTLNAQFLNKPDYQQNTERPGTAGLLLFLEHLKSGEVTLATSDNNKILNDIRDKNKLTLNIFASGQPRINDTDAPVGDMSNGISVEKDGNSGKLKISHVLINIQAGQFRNPIQAFAAMIHEYAHIGYKARLIDKINSKKENISKLSDSVAEENYAAVTTIGELKNLRKKYHPNKESKTFKMIDDAIIAEQKLIKRNT